MDMHTTEDMTICVTFLAYFGQNLVAMATPLRPLQSEMSNVFFALVDHENPLL